MNRRTVLKGGIAVALTAHTAVASGEALPSTLDTLISGHRRMLDIDGAAWERAGDLEASIENHKLPKVQTSTLYRGRDDEGNQILVPQLEKDIVAFVPSTLAEAVQKAAWCAWAFRNERCYLKDAEEEDGLIAAMDAIARAMA